MSGHDELEWNSTADVLYDPSVEKSPPPGNQPALHTVKAYELLGDGNWHDYNKVFTQVAAAVNPSHAYRRTQSHRKHPVVDPEVRLQMVRTGQRDIARTVLSRKDRFEHRRLDDGTRQVRILPFLYPTPEDRSVRSRKGWNGVDAEQRSARGRKSWETRRQKAGQ